MIIITDNKAQAYVLAIIFNQMAMFNRTVYQYVNKQVVSKPLSEFIYPELVSLDKWIEDKRIDIEYNLLTPEEQMEIMYDGSWKG